MREAALTATGIVAGYVKGLPILTDVSMTARRGAVTVLIGPNGAGKSTLIKAIAGLVTVTRGKVELGDRDITNPRTDTLQELGIAYVPQSDNIFRTLTIRQNLDLVLRRDKLRAEERRAILFEQFPDLAEKEHERAGGLSGGQRQFLAVAMALATAPSTILLDEPSAGLSPRAAGEVLAHVRKLADDGVTILLVEQNVNQALRMADDCFILADGRNQIDGPAADLLNDPVVGEIYLGGKRVRAS